ncbi:MAG: oxidoreductase, partial [Bacteroidetes bacterium]|nr:oxidoreductase [Bacteroidota bacterium]
MHYRNDDNTYRLTKIAYFNIISQILSHHYAIVDDFFEPNLVEELSTRLHTLYENDALKKAAIGKHFDEHIKTEIRGDYIQWINESSDITVVQQFFQVINHFVDYLNRTCFMGILHKEFHYAVYPKGRFYKRHLDTFDNDQRRKLSMVLYLNKIWTPKNGGDLVIYAQDHHREKA